MIKVISTVRKCPAGHKNSKGESVSWCVYSEDNGHIISSHHSKEEAKSHIRDMKIHGSLITGDLEDVDPEELAVGKEVEKEHVKDNVDVLRYGDEDEITEKITKDHLKENPEYYEDLKEVEPEEVEKAEEKVLAKRGTDLNSLYRKDIKTTDVFKNTEEDSYIIEGDWKAIFEVLDDLINNVSIGGEAGDAIVQAYSEGDKILRNLISNINALPSQYYDIRDENEGKQDSYKLRIWIDKNKIDQDVQKSIKDYDNTHGKVEGEL